MRGLTLTLMLVATEIQPISGDTDLVRYGITQGGLLAVVLVLLWFYRRDFLSGKHGDKAQIAVLTELVERNAVASERLAASSAANEKATHRLANAIEKMRP